MPQGVPQVAPVPFEQLFRRGPQTVRLGPEEIADDASEQTGRGLARDESRQQARGVGGDHEASGSPGLVAQSQPGETAQELRSVQEEAVARGQAPEDRTVPAIQPLVCLVQGDRSDREALGRQARRKVFQKGRLAAAMRADDRGPVAQCGKPREQLVPGGAGKPVSNSQDPLDREGVIPRPDGGSPQGAAGSRFRSARR